jgi:hypothetical protein
LCFYPNKNIKQAKLGKEFGHKPGLPDGIHTYLHANNPNLGSILEGLVMESFVCILAIFWSFGIFLHT